MLSNSTLRNIFKKTKAISPADLARYEAEAQKEGALLGNYLLTKKIMTEDELYRTAATVLKIPFIDITPDIIRKDILFLVPEPVAISHEIIAFNQDDTGLFIATADPTDIQIFDFISKKTDLPLKIHIATPKAISEALKQYHLTLEAEFGELTKKKEEQKPEEAEPETLARLAEDLPIVRIVDSLLDHAIFERASDIHIEPSEKGVAVRYRIDGILRNVMALPKSVQAGLVARVKILSNLKLDEHRLPQDGRFKIIMPDKSVYSFRVSVFPEMDGEKVVMRILPESAEILTLEQLGLLPAPLTIVKRNITKPHGIILVTGPTGSGKTTTLYSILHLINKPEINIQTVEDPIEYRIPRVNQSQVNPRINFTFAAGLRSILRQDPNVIMVGEIRDAETADIALHAALTGHLVFSTLHTNDAATALPRLTDMNIPPFLVAFTANLIIAQRLVRKICNDCRAPYKTSAGELADLKKRFDIHRITTFMKDQGLKPPKNAENLQLYHGSGCKKCNDSGYRGRIGIYEVLEITENVKDVIARGGTADDIAKKAEENNMITILDDGLIKVLQGTTTLEEVLRVTKE